MQAQMPGVQITIKTSIKLPSPYLHVFYTVSNSLHVPIPWKPLHTVIRCCSGLSFSPNVNSNPNPKFSMNPKPKPSAGAAAWP